MRVRLSVAHGEGPAWSVGLWESLGPFRDRRLMADRTDYDAGGNTTFNPPRRFQVS